MTAHTERVLARQHNSDFYNSISPCSVSVRELNTGILIFTTHISITQHNVHISTNTRSETEITLKAINASFYKY